METVIASRLDSLENNIRGTFDRHTSFEVEECESAINRRMRNIEYTLNGYKVASPAKIDAMVGELRSRLRGLKGVIESCRDDEKRETIRNLQETSIYLEEAIQGLERFEIEGIHPCVQDDIAYADSIQQVIDKETDEFISRNGITDERVIGELKAEMRDLQKSLDNTHGELSTRMKRTMKEKVNEIGEELVAKKQEKSQNQKAETGIPGLKGLVADEKESNDYFMRSDNERAFLGEQTTTRETSRKDLEAMFK